MIFSELIKRKYQDLGETDYEIYKYMIENKQLINNISITDLAEKTFTSKSSVLRFVQKLGFSGFTEFKYMIDWEERPKESQIFEVSEMHNYITKTMKKLENMDLTNLFYKINQSENIYLISTGFSQQYQSQTLQRDFLKMGVSMNIVPAGINSELSTTIIEKLTKKDLLIVFSSSGENMVIKEMLTIPLLKEVPIFSITSFGKSWLQNQSECNICLQIENEKDFLQNFNSTFIHLVIDYLVLNYEQFIHGLTLD